MPNVLKKSLIRREHFDPANVEHLASFDTFIRTGNWGDVQFFAEAPYTEVPITVLTKFALDRRNLKRESSDEQAQRLAKKTNLVPFVLERLTPEQARAKRMSELNGTNAQLIATMVQARESS